MPRVDRCRCMARLRRRGLLLLPIFLLSDIASSRVVAMAAPPLSPASSAAFADDHFSQRTDAIRVAGVEVPEAEPGLHLEAPARDFGTRLVGSGGVGQEIALTNSGTAYLTIDSVTVSGPNSSDFVLVSWPRILGPGGKAAIRLLYAPTAAGSRSATLTISSNAPAGPQTMALTGTATQPLPRYTVVDLGSFSAGFANAINASGQVAGWANDAPGLNHAFVTDRAGMHALGIPTPPGTGSAAWGINDAGQVVGALQGPGSQRAFVYSGGVVRDLGTLGGASSIAYGINGAGQVVGEAATAPSSGQDGPRHAFLYDSSGMRDLTPSADTVSAAYAVNSLGQVVGFTGPAGGASAFLWENGVLKQLGGLPGYAASSVALGLNDAGQIVGAALNGTWSYAFLCDDAGMHDLGTLGGTSSQADAINAAGQVVGFSVTGGGYQHAFLYRDGVMMDLNDLIPFGSGWQLAEARAINDAGQIVGLGSRDGQSHGFLLIPGLDPSAAPKAPTDLSARWVFPDEIDLAWTGNSSESFEVQVKPADGNWVRLALLPANTTTFNDNGAQGGIHYAFRVRAVSGAGVSGWSNEASDDTGVHPTASIYPTDTLSFGDEPIGTPSGTQSITITSGGDAPLLYRITLAGANPDDFSFAGSGDGSLLPGGTRRVILRFTPQAAGRREAMLRLSDNAAGSASTILLVGTGLAPAVSLSAASLSFGPVPLGASSATQSVTLTNNGSAPLTIDGVTLTGAAAGDYQIIAGSGNSILLPGATRTLTLRFTPRTPGDAPASLTITDNAPGGQQSVGLSGAGVLPGPGSRGAALIPDRGELFIAAIAGTASHSRHAILSVGQSLILKLAVSFPNGAVADVSADRLCFFGTGTTASQFTAKNVWVARPQDAGKTITLYGSYRSPVGRKRITGAVTVTVRAVRAERRVRDR